ASNCAAADGSPAAPFCTLDAALQAAVDGDRLLLAQGDYAPGSVVTEDVEIVGVPGPDLTRIVGGLGSPTVLTIAAGATVRVEGLTIQDGVQSGLGAAGLDVHGHLTLVRSRVLSNEGGTFAGPDAANRVTGTLLARETLFQDNENDGPGGALVVVGDADVTLDDCAFWTNASGFAGITSGAGGAIAVVPSSSSAGANARLAVRRTTFASNSCATPGYGGAGGALLVNAGLGGAPAVTVENCTFSGNAASVGSAVHSSGGGTVSIVASTVTDNAADNSGALLVSPPSVMTLSHSVVAGNVDVFGSDTGRDLQGPVQSLGHNVVGDALFFGGQVFVPLPSDVVDPDVVLGPLSAQGSFGGLHPLPAGSSALDIGAPVPPVATDARGVPRPLGLSDAGAYERGGFGTVDDCAARPNSTGAVSRWATQGSGNAGLNDVLLVVEGLPPAQFALFLVSDAYEFQLLPGGSVGNLCLASPITRILASTQPIFKHSYEKWMDC
ncbi:MAG: choice-of-anchor Q domain-containing protein, partial [Planctomycetota bacterium]